MPQWYGTPASVPDVNPPEQGWLPQGLRDWYALSSRWNIPREGVKRLRSASEILEEEGKFIFMSDQGGWAWAFDPDSPSAVFEAKDDEPWRQLVGDWKEFFTYHVFTEAIESAPLVQWVSDVSVDDVKLLVASMREIEFRQSSWPAEGASSYMADDVIAYAGPKRWTPGRCSLTFGAQSRESLEFLKSFTQFEWRTRRN